MAYISIRERGTYRVCSRVPQDKKALLPSALSNNWNRLSSHKFYIPTFNENIDAMLTVKQFHIVNDKYILSFFRIAEVQLVHEISSLQSSVAREGVNDINHIKLKLMLLLSI